MANTEKPVILLVHGAWHSPGYYKTLINPLRKAGYTVLAPPLATAGPDDSIIGKTIADDVKRVHETLLPQLDAGRQAVVVAHSYGGMPATESCAGHTVEERMAKGLKGGIKAMVYITAYALDKAGKKLVDYEPASHFFDVNVGHETGVSVLRPHPASQVFYEADIPCDTDREGAVRFLGDHSAVAFLTPAALGAAELRVPKTYIVCTRDDCISPSKQRLMAEGCGEGTKIVELDAGHSPFVVDRHVERLVEEIEAAACS
ncbi:Alpha/beta hydrolase fold-1 [Microdochium bolleyi]|uniref:Alpha/beta hydrolase fold-1 n=1 Tax=Microdochium bolleyi TaxID=196109 RepID=A0A136IQV2_9PEZI|nr:Alpha/beta hydrolase fold-1 [Microdochium bolleyi]